MEYWVNFMLVQVVYFLGASATFIKSAKHSSSWDNMEARYSVDGNQATFSRTGFQYDSWWTGTMDSECPLKAVEIHGEHPEMVILAGLYRSDRGFQRPTLQNPRCKLVSNETVLGQPDWATYTCDVVRNVTTIDIVPAIKKDHSLILYEVKAHCL